MVFTNISKTVILFIFLLFINFIVHQSIQDSYVATHEVTAVHGGNFAMNSFNSLEDFDGPYK